jgi:hypothetical protein
MKRKLAIVLSTVALLCIMLLFVLYFSSTAYKRRRLSQELARGDLEKAAKTYERLVKENSDVSPYSLPQIYAELYKEHRNRDIHKADEYKNKCIDLMQQMLSKAPGMSCDFAAIYDEYFSEEEIALQLYKKCLALLEYDLKAVEEGRPTSQGYQVADNLRANLVDDLKKERAVALTKFSEIEQRNHGAPVSSEKTH